MSGAIVFPPNPTTGQIFTDPNGVTWQWNGVAWVNANTAGNFATVAQATTIATNISSANVGRNLLHNAMFMVNQRGVGPWTSGQYVQDRWLLSFSGGTTSVTTETLTDADRAAIGDETAQYGFVNVFTGGAAAGNYDFVLQRTEQVLRLSGKTIIVSFWARASASLLLGVAMQQSFGTGGSPSAPVSGIGASNVTLTTSWARYFKIINLPSAAGKTLGTAGGDNTELDLAFSSGTTNNTALGSPGVQSGTVHLWGAMLEIAQPGQTAPSPLEKLDPRNDLANCQRFFQAMQLITQGYSGATGNAASASASMLVSMRAVPTVAITQDTSSGAINPRTAAALTNGLWVTAPTNAAGGFTINVSVTASADL